MNKSELEDKIESLEIKLRHIENDFELTNREYEKTTDEYLNILAEFREKNEELKNLQRNLENIVAQRTGELNESQKILQLKSEEQQIMLDSSPAMIFFKDIENRFIRVNMAFAEFVDTPIKDIIGKKEEDILPRNSNPIIENISGIIKTGTPVHNVKLLVNTLKGERWIKVDQIPYKDIEGNTSAILGFAIDITDRVMVEEELRESESKYRDLVENINEILYRIDSTGLISYISPSCYAVMGLKSKEIVNRSYLDFIYEEDIEEIEKHFKDILNGISDPYEFRINHISGDIKWVQSYSKPVYKNGKVTGIQGLMRDNTEKKNAETEKKNLEEQLFQAQKMESIGRLAGGIAHDFNNILSSIMGYAELLKMQSNCENPTEEKAVNIILKGSKKAAALTRQLLGFARRDQTNPVPLIVNQIIRESVRVSERIFEKMIKVIYDLEPKLHIIEADKNQLDQVFTNLLINAKDAMPYGGKIYFKTENIEITKESAKKHSQLDPGNYVMISFTDTGLGMPKEIKKSIFEPFFTTKGEGKGTGLGLAMVYGIVKNHGGHIEVYSGVGKGTTFRIFFPASEKEVEDAPEEIEILHGKETILVIDDEEDVRNFTKTLLERIGYKVITAKDGIEGIDILFIKKDKINLVLLDMVMPKMTGIHTFEKIKAMNKNVKVLVVSGYSKEGQAEEILNKGADGFVQKPFSLETLSLAIRDVLKKK
ncbi:MAG: PAS domain S-box protein [bacterium]|nr:PAS domain S-box protein [bacterium]